MYKKVTEGAALSLTAVRGGGYDVMGWDRLLFYD